MQAILISAGQSKRFWPLSNGIHKSQFKLLGKSLIYWTLKGLAEKGIRDICVVVRKESTIQEVLARDKDFDINISYAVQENPLLGTGNALWQARSFVKESFCVMWPTRVNAQVLFEDMTTARKRENSDAVCIGVETQKPWEYGIVKFKGGKILQIVENPPTGREPSRVKFLGACLLDQDFFDFYAQLPKHHEADFIDALNSYIQAKNVSLVLEPREEDSTVKYPWDLFQIFSLLLEHRRFRDYRAPSARIGKHVVMEGGVWLGENVVIKDGTLIQGPVYIGNNCEIGFHNVIRGPVDLEDNVRTGAFCEIKHSFIQEGTTFHSGYVGDSIIGKHCRFGAGFITANRRFDQQEIQIQLREKGNKLHTELQKLGAIIGDRTIFGIHCGTMPGALIGSQCIIGPSTQIFGTIEDNVTCYERHDSLQKPQSLP